MLLLRFPPGKIHTISDRGAPGSIRKPTTQPIYLRLKDSYRREGRKIIKVQRPGYLLLDDASEISTIWPLHKTCIMATAGVPMGMGKFHKALPKGD